MEGQQQQQEQQQERNWIQVWPPIANGGGFYQSGQHIFYLGPDGNTTQLSVEKPPGFYPEAEYFALRVVPETVYLYDRSDFVVLHRYHGIGVNDDEIVAAIYIFP